MVKTIMPVIALTYYKFLSFLPYFVLETALHPVATYGENNYAYDGLIDIYSKLQDTQNLYSLC